MGQQWILLVILTLYEVGFTTETENGEKINDSLWLYHDTLTWDEAFDFCKNIDASLAVPESEEDLAVRKAFKNNERVWVGRYTYTTPWLYPSGCFSSNNPNYTRIEENNVSTCKRFCGDSDIMVNIYNCLCVEKAPDINDRKPLGQCNTSCPSNRKEYCGGPGVFQHYATYTDIKSTKDDNDHCGMAGINTSIAIVARHCTMINAFLCAVHDNDSGDRPFYVSKYNNGSIRFLPFQDALENCVKNGSYLVDPTKLDPTQFQSGEPTHYWVGVRRNVSYVRSVQELPRNVRNQQCLYMTKGSASVTPQRTRNCSKKESFLCRKQVEPTTAIISRSESTSAVTTASILNRTLPIDITTDQGNQETPATGTELWPYIAGGAGFFITVIAVLTLVIVCLWRSRQKMSKLPRDTIPLETHNYDYLDIMNAGNEEETNGRDRLENNTDSTESTIGQNGATTCNSPKTTNDIPTCSNLSARIKRSKSSDENDSDNLYCLAENLTEGQSSPKSCSSLLACESKPYSSISPYDYAHSICGDRVKNDDSESAENSIYNKLHAPHTSHNLHTNDVYDHANARSSEGCYYELSKPGHVNKEEDVRAYDTTQHTLSSDVYNTLSIKGSKVNGNDTYDPYVDTHTDPPLP